MKQILGIFGLCSLVGSLSLAAGTYGMRYEVSTDGTIWSPSINVPPGALVKFRVGVYFTPGTTVTTTDGKGDAVAVSRFTGSQKVSGLLNGDTIQNLVRVSPTGNPVLLTVSNTTGVIGANTITSFGGQLLFDLDPYVEAPEYEFVLLQGEIKISASQSPHGLTISNNTFGSGSTPGLTFYHSASLVNKQSGRPDPENTREDHNALISVVSGGCPVPGYQSFAGTTTAQPSMPAVFNVTSATAMSYEWYKNGVALTDASRYSGLTTNQLTILQPRPSDAGSYRCRIYSVCFSYSTTFGIPLKVTCGGDLTRDGLVDDQDFQDFASAYDAFVCPPPGCAADMNADGFVDDEDFQVFAIQYDTVLCEP